MFRKLDSPPSYSLYLPEQPVEVDLPKELQTLGLRLCTRTGHLFYDDNFAPLHLDYELVFVRHGETYGNCGQSTSGGKIDADLVSAGKKDSKLRIFQGDVDTEINHLTNDGKLQALDAAKKLKTELLERGWIPDVILASPLSRAQETAAPFIKQNQYGDRYFTEEGIREMSFGSWDNLRVCDFEDKNLCHRFYLDQHTLVKGKEINADGKYHKAENFCEVILRARKVLLSLNEKYAGKKVVMFSHSMFGAACSILLGKGQTIEEGYLAFDGKHTMPHAAPFLLNFGFEKPSCVRRSSL